MQYLWVTPVKSTKGTRNPHRHTTRAWHTIGAYLFTLDRTLRPKKRNRGLWRSLKKVEEPILTNALGTYPGYHGFVLACGDWVVTIKSLTKPETAREKYGYEFSIIKCLQKLHLRRVATNICNSSKIAFIYFRFEPDICYLHKRLLLKTWLRKAELSVQTETFRRLLFRSANFCVLKK